VHFERRNENFWENKEKNQTIYFQIAKDNTHKWREVNTRGQRVCSRSTFEGNTIAVEKNVASKMRVANQVNMV
jgi:hypothetical protein